MTNKYRIFRFVEFSDTMAVGGQLSSKQIDSLKADGYEAIVRFVVGEADMSFADEGAYVQQQGMDFASIAISFIDPTEQEYEQFCHVMDRFDGKKVFVHCVAGYCSSSMVYLYQVTRKLQSLDALETRLHKTWRPNEKWETFIKTILETRGVETYR